MISTTFTLVLQLLTLTERIIAVPASHGSPTNTYNLAKNRTTTPTESLEFQKRQIAAIGIIINGLYITGALGATAHLLGTQLKRWIRDNHPKRKKCVEHTVEATFQLYNGTRNVIVYNAQNVYDIQLDQKTHGAYNQDPMDEMDVVVGPIDIVCAGFPYKVLAFSGSANITRRKGDGGWVNWGFMGNTNYNESSPIVYFDRMI